MSKVYKAVVECCYHCPGRKVWETWCAKAERHISTPLAYAIPDWCPLPDADVPETDFGNMADHIVDANKMVDGEPQQTLPLTGDTQADESCKEKGVVFLTQQGDKP